MIDRYLRELIEGGASPDVISKMLGKIGYKESEVTTLIQKYGKGVRAPEINIGQKESAKIASEYLYKHTMEANQATKSINIPSQQRDAMGHLARAQAVFENANVVIPQLPMGQINKLRTNDPLFNQIAKQVNSLTGYNLPSSTIAYNSRGIEQLSRELQKMRGLKPKFASGGSITTGQRYTPINNRIKHLATGGEVNYRHFQMNKPLKGWDRKIANGILDSRETIFGDQPGTFRMLAALDDLNDQVKGKDYYGSIVGYGNNYEPYGALSYADEGKNLWLSNLGVREPFQGRGIASNLFNSYSEHAKTSGYEGIRWQSLGIPETIEFYKKRAKLIDPRTLTFGKKFAIGGGVNPWTRKMDMFQAGHSSIRVSPHEALTTSWNPDLDKLNKAGRDGVVSPNELSGINLRNIASKIKGMFNGSLSDSKKDNLTINPKEMGVGGVLNGASTEFLQSNGANIKKFASGGNIPSFALGGKEEVGKFIDKMSLDDLTNNVEKFVNQIKGQFNLKNIDPEKINRKIANLREASNIASGLNLIDPWKPIKVNAEKLSKTLETVDKSFITAQNDFKMFNAAIEGVNKVYGKHATLVDKDRGTFNYQAYGSKEYEKLKGESQRSPLALAFKNALFEWSSRTNFMKTVSTTRYTGSGQLEVGGMSKALLTMLSESEGKLDRNNVPMVLREEFDRYQKNAEYLNTGLKDSITGVLKDQLGGILPTGEIEQMVKVGTTRISQPARGEFYEETQQSTKQLVEFDVEIDQVTEKLGKLGKSSEFIANTLNSVTSRIRKIPGLENFEMRAQTGQTQVESGFGKMQRAGEKSKELSWKMASLSMSSMGVYFSMLGLFTTLQGVVTSLASSLGDLNKTFQGIGYVNAFSRGMSNAKTIMDAFGISQKDLVSGWKSVMYIQGAVGLMFSSLASKMFNNKEFVNKLTQALTDFFSELSKTNTLEILENLMINMAKAAPAVIGALKLMGGALDVITKNQTLATAAITAFLASLIIQPISAFASASFMLVGSFIQIGAYAPAATVGINTLSKSFFTGTMAIIGYTAVIVALLEVGSRLLDMFTGWNTAFARPTTYLNAAFGGGFKDPFTGAKAFANGGEVTGANTAEVDDKVVRVDEGEYVINKRSAKKLGKSKLDQLNKYATGGSIGFLPDVTPKGMDFSKLQQTMVNTSNDNMYYMRKQNEAIDVSSRYNRETKDVLQGSAGGSRPLYVFDLSNKGISGGTSNAPIELTGDVNPINLVNVPRNYGVNVPETQVNLPDIIKSTLSEIGNNIAKNLNDAVNNILKNNETLNNNLNNILESIKNNEALNNILEAIKNNEVVKSISDAVNNILGKFTTNQNVVNPAGTTGVNFNEVVKGLTQKPEEISNSVSNFFKGIKSSVVEEAKKYGVTTPLKGETGLTGAARVRSYFTSPATSEAALGLERTSFPYRAITGEKYKGGASRYTWDWREQLYPDAMPSKYGTGALIDYRSVIRDAMRSNNNPGETAVSLLNAVAGNVITGRLATEASNIAMRGQSTILGKVAGAGVTGFTGAMRGISAVSDFMMPAEAGLAAADYRKGLTTEQIRNKMYLTNIGTGGLANEAYGRGVNYIQTSMGTAEFNKNLALQRADKSKGDYYTKLVESGNQTQIDAEIKALGEKRFKETYDKIDSYMSGLKPLIGEAATNAITDTLTGTGYALPGAGEYLATTAKGAYTALTTDPGKAITDASTSVGSALMDTATSIGSAILNPLTSIFGGFNTDMAASASVIPKTTDTLNNNLNNAGSSIGNYATIIEQGKGTTKVALDQYGNILDSGGQSTGKSLDAYNNVIDTNTGEIDKNLVVLSTTFADGNSALQKATDSVSQSLADAATKWSFVSTGTITNQPSFITGVNKQEADLNNLTFGSTDVTAPITDAISTGNEQVTNSLGNINTSSERSIVSLTDIGQKLDSSTEQSITGLTGISDKVETTNTIVPESLNAGFTATAESINSGTTATIDQTAVLSNILVTLQLIANYLQTMKLTVNLNGVPQTNLNSFTNDLTYQY